MAERERLSARGSCLCAAVIPGVTQDGGVVQRPSPVAVCLVDVGAVLQQELAGCQSVLAETQEQAIDS